MDNDPKHTSKVVAKWLKDKAIGVAITKPWPQSYRKSVGRTEKACVSKEAYTADSVLTALSGGMGQNSPNLLWKATRNIWPKLNNWKAKLPNFNWVYVNFWPTGNVKKNIKAEINNSLYYYSDISHSLNKVVILTDREFLQGLNVRNCEKLSLNVIG